MARRLPVTPRVSGAPTRREGLPHGRVARYLLGDEPSGPVASEWIAGLGAVSDMALGSGRVYAALLGGSGIRAWNASTLVEIPLTGSLGAVTDAKGIAVEPGTGHVWVATDANIRAYDPADGSQVAGTLFNIHAPWITTYSLDYNEYSSVLVLTGRDRDLPGGPPRDRLRTYVPGFGTLLDTVDVDAQMPRGADCSATGVAMTMSTFSLYAWDSDAHNLNTVDVSAVAHEAFAAAPAGGVWVAESDRFELRSEADFSLISTVSGRSASDAGGNYAIECDASHVYAFQRTVADGLRLERYAV